MTPPLYEGPASKVLEGQLRSSQILSEADNLMKLHRLCAFGPYQLDCDRHLLSRDGQSIAINEKALEILIALVQRHGEVVSKDELMKLVWPDAFVEEANLSQNVFVLRKTLGERPKENRYIATIPGRGYSFVASVEDVEESGKGILNQGRTQERSERKDSDEGLAAATRVPHLHFRRWLTYAFGTAGLAFLAAALGVIFGAVKLPWPARHYNNAGVLYQQKGDLASAMAMYRRALFLNRGYPEAHYNLGDANEEIPDYAKALEEYQSAIDADPTFYPAYNNLARLYILRQKDFAAAIRLLDHALSFDPREPSIRYTLYKNYGWATLEAGQLGQAEEYLHNAIKIDPKRGSAHCLLAKLMVQQSAQGQAQGEWESCLRYSTSGDVEPEWVIMAKEFLSQQHLTGGRQ